MAQNNNHPPTADQQAKGFFAKHKVTLILLLVLALSNAGIYFYQNSKQDQLKSSMEEHHKAQMEKIEGLMAYHSETFSKSVGQAVTFACGPEVASDDKQRLNLFFIDMVQKTEADLISVVDSVGMIYLSTDKNYEGKSILEVVPALPPRIDAPTWQKVNNKESLYASPIIFDRRLGTCVMSFKTGLQVDKMLDDINTPPNFE